MFRLRGGTVSARFTILYASVFLGSGATLLALAFLLAGTEVTSVAPAGGPVPPPSVHDDRQLAQSAAIALLMMAAVSLVSGRILAGRVLRPLRTITTATRRITAESLDRRLAVAGPADEVKALADTIDDLLERLEASFSAQRRFVANASHELRTPLATMRASLDVAEAKPDAVPATTALAGRLRTQLDRVDHLLDGFLVLARAQHGVLADADTVDLGTLIGAAFDQRAPDVGAKHLTVDVQIPPATSTRGSPALLTRLVENLVDNAVRHNEPCGWIRVTATTSATAVELTVETGGPPLEQHDVDRLAQPFERLRQERASGGSSGLGLSIVAAVAAAHGGRLELVARAGGGLRATVRLAASCGLAAS
ncbi:two-component sensor histidine kinase [Actinoplanes sp. OR16]|uniref:sensor histidine kinase n=1 Tax=Actinoplanes sp. OR16 TaxID=946334 RepID=UPI000F6D263D|nr:HAMP domain-containing sensor histidine kinase [Actinoplanes sp. OR16]BBH70946.1 two-component sensor histidine kinase [Actinoplanes sp. OR16]